MTARISITQTQITRALKGAAGAGHDVLGFEMAPDGSFRVYVSQTGAVANRDKSAENHPAANEWDEVLDEPDS